MRFLDSNHRELKTGIYFLQHPISIGESKYPITPEDAGGDIYFIELDEDGNDFTAQCFRGRGIDCEPFDIDDKNDFAFRLTQLSNPRKNLEFALKKLNL